MFQIGKTLVSEELFQKDFLCNLNACKGACCVDGQAGAPLEKQEIQILKKIYPKIKTFLRKEGLDAIESQGVFTENEMGEFETPLIDGADCAYVIYNEQKIALCGIEAAYNKGEIDFKKPVSCHLYPVRIQQYTNFTAVNYHQWQICDDACTLGKIKQVPIYEFVREALIRKFGQAWYDELDLIAKHYK